MTAYFGEQFYTAKGYLYSLQHTGRPSDEPAHTTLDLIFKLNNELSIAEKTLIAAVMMLNEYAPDRTPADLLIEIARRSGIAYSGSQVNLNDIHTRSLGLSLRVENALIRAGFLTLADVVYAIQSGEVWAIRNFGKISLDELLEKLQSRGITCEVGSY
jgi:DNA-directed RNA polymerase alpha subunit